MEKSGTFVGSAGPYVGGTISGIGIGMILMAAIEQYTAATFENFSRLILALGLIAIAIGTTLARNSRRTAESEN